jgi:hypothetical protein
MPQWPKGAAARRGTGIANAAETRIKSLPKTEIADVVDVMYLRHLQLPQQPPTRSP